MALPRIVARFSAASAAALVAVTAGLAPAGADDEVTFGDADLAACVRSTLGLTADDALTAAGMASLETLACSGLDLTSLAGLETATGLTSLTLRGGTFDVDTAASAAPVADQLAGLLTPLASLDHLTTVDFGTQRGLDNISRGDFDLDPLVALPSLRSLRLSFLRADTAALAKATRLTSLQVNASIARIADLGFVAAMPDLTALTLYPVGGGASLGPLATATGLETLSLRSATALTDWDALAALTALRSVDLSYSQAADVAWLAGADALDTLTLTGTAVTDLAPLSGSPVRALWIDDTEVASLAPLASFSGLEVLRASDAAITDVSPLAGLAGLTSVDLSKNAIADLRPLADVASVTATGQTVHLPDVAVCTLHEITAPLDRDGSSTTLTRGNNEPLVAILDGKYMWTQPNVDYFVSFANADATFTGHVIEHTARTDSEVLCPFLASPRPTVVGSTTVGSTWSVDLSGWVPTPASFTYRWIRDGLYIDGAEDATYTPTAADAGHRIAVKVTGAVKYFTPSTATSTTVLVTGGRFPATATAKATGSSVEGFTRTAATTGFPEGTTFTYQWKRDGKRITGATRKTFTLRHKDVGHKVTVTVTASKPGFATARRTAPAATVLGWMGDYAYTPLPSTARVGSTVTVKKPTFDVAASRYSYQWRRDGKAIAGATGRSYTAKKADAGHRLTVKVTGHRAGYAPRPAVIGTTAVRR
ncbi:leucine-rich repeat domain-containing protein [Demequina maris]|uniref:leucine-rich repeat domain-containing protein n=1 Tax=Demequina maris TaxID=1638982 RepID=UPI00078671EB|nr:leucine-rich repeat domain-containing protein [Demequina maris]